MDNISMDSLLVVAGKHSEGVGSNLVGSVPIGSHPISAYYYGVNLAFSHERCRH